MLLGSALGLASPGNARADPAETATASAAVDGTGAVTTTAATSGTTTRSDAFACYASECGPFAEIANSGPLGNPNQAQANTVGIGTGGFGSATANYNSPDQGTAFGNIVDATATAGAAAIVGDVAVANANLVNNGDTDDNRARATAAGDAGNAAANANTIISIGGSSDANKSDATASAQAGGRSTADANSNVTSSGVADSEAQSSAFGFDSHGLGSLSAAIANANANGSADVKTTAQSQAGNGGDSQATTSATSAGSGDIVAKASGSANGEGAAIRVNAIADNVTDVPTNAIATSTATSGVGAIANADVTAHANDGGDANAVGNASAVDGGLASTNVLIVADGSGFICVTTGVDGCAQLELISSHSEGITDSTVTTSGVAAASNTSATAAGAQILGGQNNATANTGGVAISSIKLDAVGTGCRAGAPCDTDDLATPNLTVASTIENQMGSAQVIGTGGLATSDLTATATSGGLVTDSISSATATAGGIAAAQLTNTSVFGGVTDGTTVATGDQGAYASAQCMNIAQGNANNPGSTGGECNLGSQATGVFGDQQSQAQTAAANLSFNGGASSLLGSQAGSGAVSNIVSATTDFAATQPVDAEASNALSVAGGCLVGVGCGIVISQANIPGNPGGDGCESGGISSNAANCATASVTGVTSAINGGGVEGAGIAATIGGQGTPNYASSLLTTIPGVGASFQLDSKSGNGDAIALAIIKLTP